MFTNVTFCKDTILFGIDTELYKNYNRPIGENEPKSENKTI